jgi:hypothetical protein
MLLGQAMRAQMTSTPGEPATTPAATSVEPQAPQGGVIKGTIVAVGVGKTGGIPLPGVAITATNTLTGKKYSTATAIDGTYAMSIPRNGRYVVRAELAGFSAATQEVVLTGKELQEQAQAAAQAITIAIKPTDFGMELASRAAADEAKQAAATSNAATGLQSLSLSAGGLDGSNASVGGGTTNSGATLPTLAGLGDSSADSVAVSGQTGTTNGLANFSEDEIRSRIEDAVAQGRASGMIPQGGDPTSAIVGMLGGMMGGRGPSGPGGGGGRGGRGGGGGGFGSGAFRNFNPAQPHGSVFYQGGNSALNSAPWSPTLLPQTNPSAYSNRFGASIAGSPYIPGLTKPNSKQFVFINLTGQKNLNAFLPSPVRVPTDAERAGNFSNSMQIVNGKPVAVTIYDPLTGMPFPGETITPCSGAATGGCITNQALALLKYYPEPNIATTDPTAYNYQTISNAGSNNVAINSRYVRSFGQGTNTPFGNFGGGGGRRNGGANSKKPPSLRQNINLGYNYNHAASDQRNIFLPLGGATESDSNVVNAGYTIGYGRLSNNASATWNRNSSQTRNYFTDTENDPSTEAGIAVPNTAGSIADTKFYNGLPSLNITNFAGLSNTTPSATVNQTISFSDFVSYRHKKHNMRFGFDIRRVHADSVGGNNPLGSFSFSGYTTESPADQAGTGSGGEATTGSGFADFLLGLPTQTSLQAGLNKIYLRENVYDWYVNDDYRVSGNVTLNYGLRYEYFGPYTEKYNRLVNLDHNADFTVVDPVEPGGTGMFGGKYPRSLVNPDYTMYSPRFGFAWRPKSKLAKDTVIRGGYGINFNTGQFATFAKSLSFQPPFANTQTNALSTATNDTGCTETNLTLANGFGCSTKTIQNNYAVNKDYRLGMVQSANLNIQRTIPLGIVLNVGYNLGKGSGLDIVRAPNHTVSSVTTTDAEAFTYEDSIAGSHSNQLVVSAQKRQSKGIALGVTYTYAHAIDNASSIGGSGRTIAQNDQRLDLEEGNSSFDQRHNLTGNWLLELPFGPNRAFFNKGGVLSHAVDGFSLSGTFTFATGTYFTPQYSSSAAEELSGGNYTQRPDRVFTQSIKGAGKLLDFFNTTAFVAPANGFGTASRNSIEGPGTVSANASLSRTFTLGDTRSFEARVTATNVFNTVQYSGINTTVNSANYGQVTSAASMRAVQVQARYRF